MSTYNACTCILVLLLYFFFYSAYNSCPASPGGGSIASHSTRLPSFDLMARYASKLLTQQNEGRLTPDSEKVMVVNIHVHVHTRIQTIIVTNVDT